MAEKKPKRRDGLMGMTVEQFAEELGIGRSSAYGAIKRGEVPGVVRLGGRIIIGRAAVEKMLEKSN